MQIISLHTIESSKNEQPLIVEDNSLVEGTGGQRDVKGDAPCPGLQLKIVLVNVIKSLERQVDATENIHGLLSGACCMPVAPLNITLHLAWLKPNVRIQIKDGEVIQSHLAVPPTKDVHVVLVNHRCMPKSNLRLGQQTEVIRYLKLRYNRQMLLIIQVNFLTLHVAPTVGPDLITVHVGEDVSFITASIHIELVEEAHEAMVCPRLRSILRVQIYPLLLDCLKLS